MKYFFLFAVQCAIVTNSMCSTPWWNGAWAKQYSHWYTHHDHGQRGYDHHDHGQRGYDHHDHGQHGYDHHDHGHDQDKESIHAAHHPKEYESPNSCSCLLYVGDAEVFRKDDTYNWYYCSGWGLSQCTRFCNEWFSDETNRLIGHQNACDVLGREIYTSWYRRAQVCGGTHGLYKDMLLRDDLCCRRGRPSEECSQE